MGLLDAFGVCNYLSLYHATKQDRFMLQAAALVEDVHNTLGHERPAAVPGAASLPWLPGASLEHPTRGGLRIGKKHIEDHPDGDGQYFHYLTKWAFALAAMSTATKDSTYLRWAVELVERIHPCFVYQVPGNGPKRMHWKMSVDLQRAAVPSMGNLDPFDGLVTYRLLQQEAEKRGLQGGHGRPLLESELADMQTMVEHKYSSYCSDDPLDLGEALWLSHWHLDKEGWAEHVSAVSLVSLDGLWRDGYFQQPRQWRLGFREFGTSIGLQALMHARPDLTGSSTWEQRVQDIHTFWAGHLTSRDKDITPVMYASSLNPGVWLRGNWE